MSSGMCCCVIWHAVDVLKDCCDFVRVNHSNHSNIGNYLHHITEDLNLQCCHCENLKAP